MNAEPNYENTIRNIESLKNKITILTERLNLEEKKFANATLRFEKSLSYQKALLQMELARYSLKQNEQVFVPYLQISNGSFQVGKVGGTTGSGSFSRAGAADTPQVGTELDFSLRARLINILGSDITVSEPFSIDQTGTYTPELPSLTISRELFNESGIELLKSRASYIRSEYQLREAESSVLIGLVQDILDYHYYRQLRDVQDSYPKNYERLASL